MGMIINPFMVASAAVATTKVQVRLAEFDTDDGCACSLNEYEIWENDSNDFILAVEILEDQVVRKRSG